MVPFFVVKMYQIMIMIYDLYAENENRPQLVDKSDIPDNRQQVVDDLNNNIFMIPWGHHMYYL